VRRSVIGLTALVLASLTMIPTSAQASTSTGCNYSSLGSAIDCSGSESTSPLAPTGSQGGDAPASKGQISVADGNPQPALGTDTNGNNCIYYTTDPAATTPAEEAQLRQLSHNLGETFGTCPPAAAPGAAAPPPPNPAVVAQDFWNTTPLPVPQPTIPPGWAITGKPAYLVTGGTVAPPTYTYATPLGTLTITAHGSYTVNWGDGTTNGPFDTEGLPYPNGNIAHTYDNVGTVTVTLNEPGPQPGPSAATTEPSTNSKPKPPSPTSRSARSKPSSPAERVADAESWQ
jgi:hypothetical protein